ncbi:MalY/PatB family protein [Alloscardovia omnicolens]|uniref:MalY/PatB family protein n=1 Tax=Alloscardovia omnicolens TaxID=419015 RepID=UPI003A6AFACB
MAFDFLTVYDRHGMDALAVDAIGRVEGAPHAPQDGYSSIPMWVADMNFGTAPAVTDAIRARLEHPIFGYFFPPQEYFDAIKNWQASHNNAHDVEDRHIGYENGVLGGLISTVSAYCQPGDSVLVHSPTYVGFTSCLTAAGFNIVHSPLIPDNDGVYHMDYEDMDRVLEESGAKVAIFCSPHNPTGRVWHREEIEAAMEIYAKHDCIVVSDEIWSDIIHPGCTHVPTQSVSEDARNRTVALYAPSKTFNIAGIVGAYHIIYNDDLRARVEAASKKSHYNDAHVLSVHALIGGYSSEGNAWLQELNDVLAHNVQRARDFFAQCAPEISIARSAGTYMLWLDATAWCAKHKKSIDELLEAGWRVGVGWQDGRPFHGDCHIRMNVALPSALLEEALGRLAEHVFVE